MIKVFISYAREDEAHAHKIFRLLSRSGYEPWMDKENLLPGQKWENEIEKSVNSSDVQVFLLSNNSTDKRGFFQKEINVALEKTTKMLQSDISIIPILLEQCDVPQAFRSYQWLDYFQEGWQDKLLKSLYAAAEQRGLIDESHNDSPIVNSYAKFDVSPPSGFFRIEYTLPKIEIPSDPGLSQTINSIFEGRAGEIVMQFRRDAHEFNDGATVEHPYVLEFHAEVRYLSDQVISSEIMVYRDTGGAHGYWYTKSLNIFVKEGSKFSASDVLSNYSGLFQLISEEAKKTDEQPLVAGYDLERAVREALLSNTTLSPDGLEVKFNQYDIFCYAHGPSVPSLTLPTYSRGFHRGRPARDVLG